MTRPLAVLATAAVAAGCAGSDGASRNKAGTAATPAPHVLRIESANGGSEEALYFAERVAARSGGTLKVDVRQSFPSTVPANEARLARAVSAGKVDFAIVPARAWPAAGAPAFAAVQAPFVLGDYEVVERALAGPAGPALTHELERAGVVALGLVPAQLRRVLAVTPLATAGDYRGLRIRTNDNDTAAAGLLELGAKPVQVLSNETVVDRLERGGLDGVEVGPNWAFVNDYWRDAHHITAYALFPSVETVIASSGGWKRMSTSQQAALRAAAEDAARFGRSLAAREAGSLKELCGAGVRVTATSAAQLEAIAEATEPVRAALRRARATAQVMRAFEATVGAGPRLLPAPSECSAPLVEDERRGPPRAGDGSTLPEGQYVTKTTREDFVRHGDVSWPEPVYTWTVRLRDGKWERTIVPEPAGQVGDLDGAGTYVVRGDRLTFHYTHPRVDAEPPETLRWSYYDGLLTLKAVEVVDTGTLVLYTAHPWRHVR